jgi:hypothetical protein
MIMDIKIEDQRRILEEAIRRSIQQKLREMKVVARTLQTRYDIGPEKAVRETRQIDPETRWHLKNAINTLKKNEVCHEKTYSRCIVGPADRLFVHAGPVAH